MKSSIPEKFNRVKIDIDRLGADSNDDFIQNVNVIWTAKHPDGGTCIIGWYVNATVYRKYQTNIWYADEPRGKQILKDVLNNYPSLSVPSDVPVYPDEIDPQEPLVEGARRRVTVNAYERNPKAREKCLEKHGYRCAVCKMCFEEYYGDIGRGFIHVHHIKELSSISGEYEIDPVKDLRPVCPNCHAMLHREKPALSVDDLRQRLTHKMKDNKASV